MDPNSGTGSANCVRLCGKGVGPRRSSQRRLCFMPTWHEPSGYRCGEFIVVTSYGQGRRPGKVKLVSDLTEPIVGKDVFIGGGYRRLRPDRAVSDEDIVSTQAPAPEGAPCSASWSGDWSK